METAIYVRVSTEEQAQEGFSIRAQEQKLKDYARIKEWSIYNIYMSTPMTKCKKTPNKKCSFMAAV